MTEPVWSLNGGSRSLILVLRHQGSLQAEQSLQLEAVCLWSSFSVEKERYQPLSA